MLFEIQHETCYIISTRGLEPLAYSIHVAYVNLFWGQDPPTVRKTHYPLELGRRTFVCSLKVPIFDYCELSGTGIFIIRKVRMHTIVQSIEDEIYTNNPTAAESY